MKIKLLTIILVLFSSVLFAQTTATINSKTDRANAAGTDAFLIQTSGNVTYKIRLDSIKKYSISKWVTDSSQYVWFVDTNSTIATQYDISTLPAKVPYSDTTSKVVTLTQLNDSLQADFGHLYKNSERTITIASGGTYQTIKVFEVDGQKSSVSLNDSSFIIPQTGTYLITYSGSIYAGAPGVIQTKIIVNSTPKNEGSCILDLETPSKYGLLSASAVLSVAYGDVIKLIATYDSATTLTHSTVNMTILRLY